MRQMGSSITENLMIQDVTFTLRSGIIAEILTYLLQL